MTEATFRAVVASVLVAALALAVVVALFVLRPPSPAPAPSASPSAPPTAAPLTAAPTATPAPPHVFENIGVTGVGDIPRGGSSGNTLVLRFMEPSPDAIPDAAGSFLVTLTDHAGAGTTVAFTGTASIDAPGSLGVSADLVAKNVLKISIKASDTFNVEPIIITGLGIGASPTTALGSIDAVMSDFTGSFVAGVANDALPSPGTVIAGR